MSVNRLKFTIKWFDLLQIRKGDSKWLYTIIQVSAHQITKNQPVLKNVSLKRNYSFRESMAE